MEKRRYLKYVIICLSIGITIFLVRIAGRFRPNQSNEMKSLALKDYPELFSKDVIIVIGKNATEVERECVVLIKENLKKLTGDSPIIKNDTELLELDKRTHSLILVGTPNTNYALQELYKLTDATRVTNEYPGDNKGILEILTSSWNSDKVLLIVAGSDEWGVKASSEMLTENKEIKEFSDEIMMTEFAGEQKKGKGGVIASDMLDTIMDYIKRNHPDAGAFIKEGMSWTRSSVDIRVGYTRYVYTANGWTVTIGYAITLERVYEARAEYNERIVWTGTIKDDAISERSYVKT